MDFPLQKTTYRVRFLLPWGVATYGMTSFNGIGFLSIIKNGDDKQKNNSEILESIYLAMGRYSYEKSMTFESATE